MIRINSRLEIPESELSFSASRSAGPGGQSVNKVNSRVTLHFDVGNSPTLTEAQRSRLQSRLSTRINRDGVLKMHSQVHRSQAANRTELTLRFATVLARALTRQLPRKKTRKPRSAERNRLNQKTRRAALKRTRAKRIDDND